MQLVIRGKNLEITESLRALAEAKLGKLDRYLDSITEVVVELTHESAWSAHDRNHVDVALMAGGSLLLRAEARGADMRTALDSVLGVLQSRMGRLKGKRRGHGKVSAAKTAGAVVAAGMGAAETDDEVPLTVETRVIELKPLAVDEAIDELELAGRPWLIFINADSSQVNVLERQSDGNLTLYVPTPE